jgi:hypothetical protein
VQPPAFQPEAGDFARATQPLPKVSSPISAHTAQPPDAQLSPDGKFWWNGSQWLVVGSPPADFANPWSRAVIASIAIGAVGAIAAVGVILSLVDAAILARAVEAGGVSDADSAGIALRALARWPVYSLARVAAAVLFCLWIHRASRNLRALGASEQSFSPRWAVGWWFVPLASWVMPFRVANEIWRASDPSLGTSDRATRMRMPYDAILILWWGAWVGQSVLWVFAFLLNRFASSPGDLINAAMVGVIAGTIEIAATVLAIMLIRDITRRQREKQARMTGS